MMRLLVLARLPIAVAGGWLTGHLYLRALWFWLARRQRKAQRDRRRA